MQVEQIKTEVLAMLLERNWDVSQLMGVGNAYSVTMEVVRYRHALACGLRVDSDVTLQSYIHAIEQMQKIHKILKHHFDYEAQIVGETFKNERAYLLHYTIYFPEH
jgi:hypothetical protein